MMRWRPRLRCSQPSICASREARPSMPACRYCCAFCRFHRLQRRDLLRLQPDDDEMAFHFAAGCAEHHAGGVDSDGRAHRAGLCFHFRRIERQGPGAVRPYHHRALLVSPGIRAERASFRLPLFPLLARSPPCPDRRSVVDPADRPRRRRRGAVAGDRERRGQAALAGRRAVAVGRGPRPVHPQRPGARRHRRCRGRGPRLCADAESRFRGS